MKDDEARLILYENSAVAIFPGHGKRNSFDGLDRTSLSGIPRSETQGSSDIISLYLQHVGTHARKRRHRCISQELGAHS